MHARASLAIAIIFLLGGCDRTTAVGPFRVLQTAQITVRSAKEPNSARIVTAQGNGLFMYMRPKTDRDAAYDLDLSRAIMGYTRLIPKEGVPWIRAYSHRRADGAQVAQIDYRRLNDSTEITAPEVISINRFVVFRDHVVYVLGLLIKGDLEKDFAEVDRLIEHLRIAE